MKRTKRLGLVFLCLLATGFAGGAAVHAAAAKPDFTLGVNPTSQSVQQGQSAVYAVSAAAVNGFTGSVSLTASGQPTGASAAFSPAMVTPSASPSGTSTLTVTTSASTPIGSYPVKITGTSGKLDHAITVGLTVNRPLSPSFAVSVTPASVTVPPGSTAVYAVAISRTNYSGPLDLRVDGGLPSGAMASFNPSSPTGDTSTLQVTTAGTTPEGGFTLYVVASGTVGSSTRYAYAQTQLVVTESKKSFTISGAAPGPLAPGLSRQPLDLTLRNPNNQDLAISNLTVTVARTSSPGCDPANFQVIQYRGAYPLTLAARQSASLSQLGVAPEARPQLGMLDLPANQDACKGVTLTLAYSGSGQGA